MSANRGERQGWFKDGTLLGSMSLGEAFEYARQLIARGSGDQVEEWIQRAPTLATFRCGFGRTLMMEAIFYRMEQLALAILPASDPTIEDGSGKTLLMMAAEAQLPELCQALLPLSDAKAKSKHGDTALHLIFATPPRDERRSLAMIAEIAKAGNPSEANSWGWTALHAAINSDWIGGVEILAPQTDMDARALLYGAEAATAEEMARAGAGTQSKKLAMLQIMISARERRALEGSTPRPQIVGGKRRI